MPNEFPSGKVVKIGRYRLMRQLGRGGMGTVHLAVDENLKKEVALKVLAHDLAGKKDYVERFHREARAAARLNHPNIVAAIDVGHDGHYHYFVMEYIDGVMLKKRLALSGPLAEEQALDICEKIASALEHAAAHQIIHRDIKPDNIMMTRDGIVKLTDMGLAKDLGARDPSITHAGTMIGTPLYASPEQLRGDPNIDGRTDIYSLGITLYHLLVGRPPFDGENMAVITLKHFSEEVPSPRLERPEISESTARLVWKMTRPRREERYQNATELLEDVRRVLRGETISGPPPTGIKVALESGRHLHRHKPFRPRTGFPYLVAGIFGLATLVGAIYFLRGGGGPSSGPPGIGPMGTTQPAGTGPVGPSSIPVPPSGGASSADSGGAAEDTGPAAEEILEVARAVVGEIQAKEDFLSALEELGRVEAFLGGEPWSTRIGALRGQVLLAAENRLSEFLALTETALTENRLDDMEALLRVEKARYPPTLEARRNAARKKLEAARAAARAKEAQPADEAASATKDLAGVAAALFRGKVHVLDGGRVQLSYDFSHREELEDWLPGGGGFLSRGDRLETASLESRKLLWHRGHFVGDVSLEFSAPACEGLGGVIAGNGEMASGAQGLSFSPGFGSPLETAIFWLGSAQPLASAKANLQQGEACLVQAQLRGMQVLLSVNGSALVNHNLSQPAGAAGNRVALAAGASPVAWESVKITGRLDRRWIEEELEIKPLEVSGGDWALRSDGQENASIVIPSLAGIVSGTFTWEGWFRLPRQQDVDLFFTGDPAQSQEMRLYLDEGGRLGFIEKSSRTTARCEAASPFARWDKWAHVSVVRDTAQVRLFVDGKRVQSAEWHKPETPYPHAIWVGYGPRQQKMSGLINELRFSRTPRYSSDFKPKRRLETDAAAEILLRFDEGFGPSLMDSARGVFGCATQGMEWVHALTGKTQEEMAAALQEAIVGDAKALPGLEFHEQDDQVIFEDRPEFNPVEQLTIETWIKIKGFNTLGSIVEKAVADSPGGTKSYSLVTGMDQRIYFIVSGPNDWYRLGSKPVKVQVIQHVAATFDRGQVRLFVNGELHGEAKWALRQLLVSRGGPLLLGNTAGRGRKCFDGRTYQVRLSQNARYLKNFTPTRRLERDKNTFLVTWMEEGEGDTLRGWPAPGGKTKIEGRISGAEWVVDSWIP